MCSMNPLGYAADAVEAYVLRNDEEGLPGFHRGPHLAGVLTGAQPTATLGCPRRARYRADWDT
jgi:hypothetical protein